MTHAALRPNWNILIQSGLYQLSHHDNAENNTKTNLTLSFCLLISSSTSFGLGLNSCQLKDRSAIDESAIQLGKRRFCDLPNVLHNVTHPPMRARLVIIPMSRQYIETTLIKGSFYFWTIPCLFHNFLPTHLQHYTSS